MTRINLSGGSYQAQSAAAAAQRCLNLYPEPLPQAESEPIQFVHYPTPGLNLWCNLFQTVRYLYVTSQGHLIAVSGQTVNLVKADGTSSLLGRIQSGSGPCRMQDNGLVCVVVDGSANGWYFTVPTDGGDGYGKVTEISDPAFYGANTVTVLDTFFIFDDPQTNHWYVSPANYAGNSTPFDSLYIASKTSYPDNVVGVTVLGQTIWIFGTQTTELWYNSGAADFPFQRIPSIMADQGCEAPYSIATNYGQVFWVGRDRSGHARVYMGEANETKPVSTFAIEQALNGYGDLSGATGYTYQQDGHQFYVVTIPDTNKTWVFDAVTGLWHERCSYENGQEVRYRPNCFAAAYGKVFAGDYWYGRVYEVRADAVTENGAPIKRQRAFPHLLTDGRRAIHRKFMLDMQNGAGQTVLVDWSDDRGATFGTPQTLQLGTSGNVWPTLWRLGMARDRVYRLTWIDSAATALMGAFLDADMVSS